YCSAHASSFIARMSASTDAVVRMASPPKTNPNAPKDVGISVLGFGFWDLLRRIGRRFQHQLLRAPVRQLADDDAVRVAAVDLVHRSELLHLLAGLAEATDDLPVQLHLVDFAVVEVIRVVRVRREQVLVRAR